MPIDNEDERRFIAGVPFDPDGAIDSESDRRHIAGIYRGITPAPEPSDAVRVGNLILLGVGR